MPLQPENKLVERLRELVWRLIENDPDEPVADNGCTVFDLWRPDAIKTLAALASSSVPEQDSEQRVREIASAEATEADIQFELNISIEFGDYDRAERLQRIMDSHRRLFRLACPPPPAPQGASPTDCEDCPPADYPTDETRCLPCPRRGASQEDGR